MTARDAEPDFNPFMSMPQVTNADAHPTAYRPTPQSQPRPDSPPAHLSAGVPSLSDVYLSKKHVLPNGLYGSVHSPELQDHDPTRATVNGFAGGPYRTSTAFNAFSNARPRQNTAPAAGGAFRDAYPPPFPTAADVFGANPGPAPLPQQLQHVDSIPAPGRHFDYDSTNAAPSSKYFSNLPITHDGRYVPNPTVLQSQPPVPKPIAPQQPPQHPQHPYVPGPVNGMHVAGPPQFSGHAQAPQPQPQSIPPVSSAQQEEICTIFVVGFPDDMQEREFQNMFTFSPGFEAATLKIPNKDMNGYGGNNGQQSANVSRTSTFPGNGFNGTAAAPGSYQNEPFNGDSAPAWPASAHAEEHFNRNPTAIAPDQAGHVTQIPSMPPRKQIIGFAKFKTRAEALEARDILQGRRVDIEKGAVLKAEMAKKNLHTKRGVGPLGLPISLVSTGGTVGPETLANLAGMNGLLYQQALGNGEALAQRERELGALGAMGLAPVAQRARERDDEDKLRRGSQHVPLGLSDLPRGGVGREDDDKERRRKEKDSAKPRMSAYDAFHSVPATSAIARPTQAGAAVVSPTEVGSPPSYPFSNAPPAAALAGVQTFSSQDVFAIGSSATWGKPSERYSLSKQAPVRPVSPSQPSPPNPEAAFSSMPTSSSSSVRADAAASPPVISAALPQQSMHAPLPVSNRSYSPPGVTEHPNPGGDARSMPTSSTSSVVGSESGELPRSMASLNMGTHNGMTSPQLPSPASGGSSTTANTRMNGADQNPPINTLYVGNLPTSPPPNLPPNHLEESLRSLFSRCPGYRKLCFRQKSNGPMCFVEFDDVAFATKAINDMYGDQLNGLVKTGIRLSYSKNPLGVRTSTNAGSGTGRPDPAHAAPMSIQEAFHGRHGPPGSASIDLGHPRQRDESRSGSNFDFTSPPSRFFPSPPAGRSSFNQIVGQPPIAAAYSRLSTQGQPISPFSPGFPVSSDSLDGLAARESGTHSLTPSPGLEMASG